MKKLCYVISDVDFSHQLEATFKFTDSEKFDLSLIFLADEEPTLYRNLKSQGYNAEYIKYRGKKDLPMLVWHLGKLFRRYKPDIVHAHLVNASIAGLLAAKLRGVERRIHTRHHSNYHYKYHPHAVYYDKVVNSLSTHIVAITDMVAKILKEKEGVRAEKVSVVRHGFDWRDFERALRSPLDLKPEYGLTGYYPIIGVISRHLELKGLQYIIPAFKELLVKYPGAKLVLANAVGPYRPQVEELLKELNHSTYALIEFEKRVFDLYHTFDVFIHAPIGAEYEAFGQIYVEALAMRVPSVFTLSGVASDFIKDEFNALVVPYCNSDAIFRAVVRLLSDENLRESIVRNGEQSVREMFDIRRMIEELEHLYL